MTDRPQIPNEMQRQVRDLCGFACAVCGKMPTQIEHIDPYVKVQKHEFNNLILLCANCHQEVTSGRMGKGQVRAARNAPFSKRGDAALYAPSFGAQYTVNFGTMVFETVGTRPVAIFMINGVTPFLIKLGRTPLFTLTLCDTKGNVAFAMTDNVLEFKPSKLWDVKLSGKYLKIRYGDRHVIASIRIEDGNIFFESMRIAINRVPVIFDRNGLHFPLTENLFSNCHFISHVDTNAFFVMGEGGIRSIVGLVNEQTATDAEAWEISRKFRSVPPKIDN